MNCDLEWCMMPDLPELSSNVRRLARRRPQWLVVGLSINALLLTLVLGVLIGRGTMSRASMPFESIALGQPSPQPIAGGAGFYVMPAQLDRDTWGCYVMDVDAQTLVAYQYDPKGRNLRLVAARSFQFDRQLRSYNTTPSPLEIRQIVDLEREQAARDAENGTTPVTTRPVVPE